MMQKDTIQFLLLILHEYGPVAIWTYPTGVIPGDRMRFLGLLVFRTVTSISFFFLFLEYNCINFTRQSPFAIEI
jgi:hypothetical protein